MKHKIEMMISEQEIKEKVAQLGAQISKYYQNSDNLVMIGLLRGSLIFMADLARAITVNHSVDFLTASSYGNNMESTRDIYAFHLKVQNSVGICCWR